jgi:hypothetical protein
MNQLAQKEMTMNTQKLNLQDVRESQGLSPETPFRASIVLTGAALGGLLGGLAAVVATVVIGVEWPLPLVMGFQGAMSFAMVGGWIAASFAMDDRDDAASPDALPAVVPFPIASATRPTNRPPRIAA